MTASTRPATDLDLAPPPLPPPPSDVPASSVWRDREFRALWASLAWSLAGDQLTRVALTVLLYAATGSALWAVAGGAVSLIAPVVGAPLLSWVADRWPRRRVMVVCDITATALIGVMALPGMPVPVMVVLLLAAALVSAPFAAARSALLRDVFPDNRRYAAAIGVQGVTAKIAFTVGVAAGGLLVAVLGARPALLVDAATFALSAVLIRWWVADRPAARAGRAPLLAGFRLISSAPAVRTPALYGWLAAFYIAPVAVVAPYATEHGGGAAMIGTLLAVQTLGTAVATWILTTRVRPAAQARSLVPGAFVTCVPLALTATDPGVPVVAVLWAISGAGACYQVAANTAFQMAVPDADRGSAFGAVLAVLLAGQGAGLLAVAALAGPLGPSGAVAVSGAAGTVAALLLMPAGNRLAASLSASTAGSSAAAGASTGPAKGTR